MAITLADFNKIWASSSPLTPYSFSEAQYKEGWNFIGGTPPSRQMWDFLQKNNDEKMQYLANNYLPLSGGTMTGNTLITMGNGESYVRNWGNGLYLGGTKDSNNASTLALFTNSNANGFQLQAGDGTTFKRMVGNPDGTLTWDGQPLLPVGIVQAYAGTTIPNGWLLCDGRAVSRTTYANLYACIGDTYGAGDGSTTFNVPNLVDKFVEGSATAGTEKSAGLPNIKGSFGFNVTVSNGGSIVAEVGATQQAFSPQTASSQTVGCNFSNITSKQINRGVDFDASRSSSVYGNSATVQPPALTMQYIIKY